MSSEAGVGCDLDRDHELGLQPKAYDPHLDVDFTPLRGDDPPGADGYVQAA
ncbi:hypothetical protein ACFU6I_44115 [Streptomyces sp. NPDC057486]|uniref:hypothetical protein n=1 Tax=Streptomyces sp. NPDC057486 TaxID=3346145 RepID=UPI00369DC0E4